MDEHFRPRRPWPTDVVRPVPIDPEGRAGPTRGQAAGPRWRATSRALFVPADVADSPHHRIVEAAARLPDGGAVGGWASLLVRGAAYFGGGGARAVPLVVRRPANVRPAPGIRVARRRDPFDLEEVHGIPCDDVVSAVLDVVARAADHRATVVAVDMALAAEVVTLERLRAVCERRVPGVRRLREVLPLVDGRSLSPPESWLRLIWVLDARLPRPRCNWPLFDLDGYPLGRPDLVCEELGVAVEHNGGAHASPARRRVDAERADDFRRVGLELLTVVGCAPGSEWSVARRLLDAAERSRAWQRPQLWRLGVLDVS